MLHHDPDRDVVIRSESSPGEENNKKLLEAGGDDLETIKDTGSPLRGGT